MVLTVEDYGIKPYHRGEKVGLNAAERTIFLKNEEGEVAEVLPLVYILWRKANGENSLEDIIQYTIQRTQKKRNFVEKIVFDIYESLQDQGLLKI
ncbi:MAG: hypothetical protein ACTSRS_08530 [Candidatus Helarchaeota archaeon]